MKRPTDEYQTSETRLVLASASPRRAALLREYGFEFSVIEPTVEEPERLGDDLPPAQLAEALSHFKARSVATIAGDAVILGADTVVAAGTELFGKPKDCADARRILLALSGTAHEVITGVTLLDPRDGRRQIVHEITIVTMRRMGSADLDAYLASGNWAGKAGAYGIQDEGMSSTPDAKPGHSWRDPMITSIQGSFTNVVGLPMELITRLLADWGVHAGVAK
ncbi:MAG: septum formation protein Maf [Planctomycetes bacterium]|nr:septum formation protein Maf [Planctomycetota bacterium]